MSMKKALAYLQGELRSAEVGARSREVTLDDLLSVVLRLDPYTSSAATHFHCQPEEVTAAQRDEAKRAAMLGRFLGGGRRGGGSVLAD